MARFRFVHDDEAQQKCQPHLCLGICVLCSLPFYYRPGFHHNDGTITFGGRHSVTLYGT